MLVLHLSVTLMSLGSRILGPFWVSCCDQPINMKPRGLGGVVGLTLPMAHADRGPYTTYCAATLDKLLTSHCL